MLRGSLNTQTTHQDAKNYQSINFEEDHDWDFVMVFPGASETLNSNFVENTVNIINSVGLDTYLYWSVQHDEIFCKIRCPLETLKRFAEHTHFRLLLDEQQLEELAKVGWPEKGVTPMNISHNPSITQFRPFEYIHTKYVHGERFEHLYFREDSKSLHPFSSLAKLKLIPVILEYAGIDTRTMISKNQLLAFFPLHSSVHQQKLKSSWLKWNLSPWNQPLREIKDYFGEEVGLYFAFLGHYTTWLFPLSIVGFFCFLEQLLAWSVEASGALFFSVFVSFWSILMLKYWQRKESKIAMMWGTTGFEEHERPRPNFKGTIMKSVVTGEDEMYDSPYSRRKALFLSQAIILTFVIVIVAAIVGVFSLKVYLKKYAPSPNIRSKSSTIASFTNAFQIQFFDYVYNIVAVYLTEKENHRTDTEYKDSLIAKLFVFKFMNSYSSLYYIAFLQATVEGFCDLDSCMLSLGYNLAIIFLTRIVMGNINQIVLPKVKQMLRKAKETKGPWRSNSTEHQLSFAEANYIMEPYDHIMSMISDYSDLCIEFGYVTLFVTAFPLAPLFAFLSNYAEIRTDGYKLLFTYRRFEPYGAEDIGLWQDIFTFTAIIAVITNSGIVYFTTTSINIENTSRIWFFFVFIIIILICMAFFSMLSKPTMDEVKIQLERQTFIVKRLILGQSDRIHMKQNDPIKTMDTNTIESNTKKSIETNQNSIQIFTHDKSL